MPRTTAIQFIPRLFGCTLPIILPPIHIAILYYFWREFGRRVNRQYCSCSCWDTIFKGTYESGVASYKHLYFNATPNTMKIWIATVIAIILLYETCKHIVSLTLERRGRSLMCVLFLSSLFSHYYTWWVYVNYWNDDFYDQWNHQLFFTLTEVISTIFVVHLADTRMTITPTKIIIVISIAAVHVLAGGLDQFLSNVIFGEGLPHQVFRDIFFMVPDVLHIVLPIIELGGARRRDSSILCNIKRDLSLLIFIVMLGCSIFYIV